MKEYEFYYAIFLYTNLEPDGSPRPVHISLKAYDSEEEAMEHGARIRDELSSQFSLIQQTIKTMTMYSPHDLDADPGLRKQTKDNCYFVVNIGSASHRRKVLFRLIQAGRDNGEIPADALPEPGNPDSSAVQLNFFSVEDQAFDGRFIEDALSYYADSSDRSRLCAFAPDHSASAADTGTASQCAPASAGCQTEDYRTPEKSAYTPEYYTFAVSPAHSHIVFDESDPGDLARYDESRRRQELHRFEKLSKFAIYRSATGTPGEADYSETSIFMTYDQEDTYIIERKGGAESEYARISLNGERQPGHYFDYITRDEILRDYPEARTDYTGVACEELGDGWVKVKKR
ncbi:MAG: hypothetical protein ACOYB8_05265 [Eubacteriaceae bacterium]